MTHLLIFFGSDQYSAVVLADLLKESSIKLLGVVTDRQEGGSPVENLAKTHHLPIHYYPNLPDDLPQGVIGLCASFDHLLPADLIKHFSGRLYNLHPSLLPQYRNVSPVQYSLAMGDQVTGITLFRISEGIDSGEILGQISQPITSGDTTPTLTSRLFGLGAQLFTNFLQGSLDYHPVTPSHSLIFTKRLTRDSGFLEWPVLQQLLAHQPVSPGDTANELLKLRLTHNPAGNILADLVRALATWPGVWSEAPTKKGDLRLSVESVKPQVTVKLAGKPKPITWSDFELYYL